MKKIFKKQITLNIILVISIGLFGLGLVSLLRLLDQRLTRVLEIKEQIATYEINKRSFSEEAQEIKLLQERFEKLKNLVVTPATLPSVLSQLETLSAEKKVDFQITGVTTPLEEGKKKLRIDFTAVGDFSDVSNFLETVLKQSFAASFINLEMVLVPKVEEPVATIDQKKSTTVVSSREPQWRTVGTIEILSF